MAHFVSHPTDDMQLITRNAGSAMAALGSLRDGLTLHGLTDGSWSMTDGLSAILHHTGYADVIVSTWTAADADLRMASQFLEHGHIASFRLLVDRSFENRQPAYCATARALFGDAAIRVWSAHAKFALVLNGRFPVLYLTSANMNANKRLENFTAICGGDIPAQYLAVVESLYAEQKPGEAFGLIGQRRARGDTAVALDSIATKTRLPAATVKLPGR